MIPHTTNGIHRKILCINLPLPMLTMSFFQLQIKHPKEAIEAGFKRLTDLQTKLQAFVSYMNEYYEK